MGHINVDNYFTVFSRKGHGQSLPPDVGFLQGIFSWNGLSAEAGIDFLGGTDNPLFFNAKIAISEDKLFCHAPSMSLGIFNIGTRRHGHQRTNQNIVDFVIGRSLPDNRGGDLYIGIFSGSKAMDPDCCLITGHLRDYFLSRSSHETLKIWGSY